MANEAIGHATVFARKPNSTTWGTGAAAVVGATNQIEVESESFTADSQLIENMGLNGSATQLPGVKGNELHDGQYVAPLYYRGLEGIIYRNLGTSAGAGAQQGSDLAYLHEISLADHINGIYDTFVACNSGPAIREWSHLKYSGFELLWEDGKYGRITVSGTPSGLNYNNGVAIANRIVASVEPANGVRTIANQPTTPSPLSILVTDANASITEYVLTIVGTDRDDRVITEVYRLSVNGLTFTTSNYYKTVTSVTGSGLAGTATGDTLVVGVTNGANNDTSVASITFPSTTERNLVLFSELELLLNDHSGAALATSDEVFIKRAMIKFERAQEGVVTTNLGNRRDEPFATDFVKVTFAFDLADWNTANHARVLEYLFGKPKKKATLTATGPIVNGTTASLFKVWLQNMQFGKGSPNTGGPGRMPFQVEGRAYRALATPTGFSDAKCIRVHIVNGNSGNANVQ